MKQASLGVVNGMVYPTTAPQYPPFPGQALQGAFFMPHPHQPQKHAPGAQEMAVVGGSLGEGRQRQSVPRPAVAPPQPQARSATSACCNLRTRIVVVVFCVIVAQAPINLGMSYTAAVSSNWWHLLAWIFVGMPAMVLIAAALVATRSALLSEHNQFARCEPAIAVTVTLLFGLVHLAFGLPFGISQARVKAANEYVQPNMYQNVSCWHGPQPLIAHSGRLHFLFLVEDSWNFTCTNFRFKKHTYGSHYYSVVRLEYTGRAKHACPYAYYAACYTPFAPTCDSARANCFMNIPANTVFLQLVNQNEQFYQALPGEEESQFRGMVSPTATDQLVLFGSDEPSWYQERKEYHERVSIALAATLCVLQVVVAVLSIGAAYFHWFR